MDSRGSTNTLSPTVAPMATTSEPASAMAARQDGGNAADDAAHPAASSSAASPVDHGMSTDKIMQKCLEIFKTHFKPTDSGRNLDIGSGRGTLVRHIRAYAPHFQASCVDYVDTLMSDKSIKVDLADLNHDPLPYPDNEFDFISCLEVLEHLENFRGTVLESYRVLKPGGRAVFSTPNVLNIKSRIRYFLIGFPSLFSPLGVGPAEKFSLKGHITPVSFYFLAHALSEAGYKEITLHFDRTQRSAIVPLFIFYPMIQFFGLIPIITEYRKTRLNKKNWPIFKKINSIKMLTSRTIIVTARK